MTRPVRNNINITESGNEMRFVEREIQTTIYPRRLKLEVTESILLRQNLSESDPNKKPPMNIPIEYIHCEYGFQDSLTQKCIIISGKIGINIPTPRISRNAVRRISGRLDLFEFVFSRIFSVDRDGGVFLNNDFIFQNIFLIRLGFFGIRNIS